MDPSELKKLQRATRKLQKSSISIETLLSQLIELLPKEQVLKKSALELPTPSFAEDPRIAEDLVQSLILPIDILKMHEADPKLCKHGAFQLVIQV